MRIHPTVSIALVKPHTSRSQFVPPVVLDGQDEWEVDSITDHHILRQRGGKSILEFRVVWRGAYEDSWHEVVDFEHCVDVLSAYLYSLTPRSRKRVLQCLDARALSWLPSDLKSVVQEPAT